MLLSWRGRGSLAYGTMIVLWKNHDSNIAPPGAHLQSPLDLEASALRDVLFEEYGTGDSSFTLNKQQ